MKLSEAILKGCEMTVPSINRGWAYKADNAACALGAALVATVGWEGIEACHRRDEMPSALLMDLFPPLRASGLFGTIIGMNDRGTPREEIAAILAERGL